MSLAKRLLAEDDTIDVDWSPSTGIHQGKSALFWAAFYGHFELLSLILEKNPRASTFFKTTDGDFPGMNAIWFACDAALREPNPDFGGRRLPWLEKLIRVMIEHNPGVDVHAAPIEGKSKGKKSIYRYLVWQTREAIYAQQWELVMFLARYPMNIEWPQISVDNVGKIPLPVLKALILRDSQTYQYRYQYRQMNDTRLKLEALFAKVVEIFFDRDAVAADERGIGFGILGQDVIFHLALMALRAEDPDLAQIDGAILKATLVTFADPKALKIRRTARWIGTLFTTAKYPIARRFGVDHQEQIMTRLDIHDAIHLELRRFYDETHHQAIFTPHFRNRVALFLVIAPSFGCLSIRGAILKALGPDPTPEIPHAVPPLDLPNVQNMEGANPETKRLKLEEMDPRVLRGLATREALLYAEATPREAAERAVDFVEEITNPAAAEPMEIDEEMHPLLAEDPQAIDDVFDMEVIDFGTFDFASRMP